jgi:1-phosphofructokinase/tagatose 6-phosphate kinase
VAARYSGQSPVECLRMGVACGAESTARMGAGVVEPREVNRLLSDVDIGALEPAAELN